MHMIRFYALAVPACGRVRAGGVRGGHDQSSEGQRACDTCVAPETCVCGVVDLCTYDEDLAVTF